MPLMTIVWMMPMRRNSAKDISEFKDYRIDYHNKN